MHPPPASPPPHGVTEFFPRMSELTVRESAPDPYGRRGWVIGATRGDDVRVLQGFFIRCAGRSKAFLFRVPGTDEAVVARFDVDDLRVVTRAGTRHCAPVPIREMFAP